MVIMVSVFSKHFRLKSKFCLGGESWAELLCLKHVFADLDIDTAKGLSDLLIEPSISPIMIILRGARQPGGSFYLL